jgi:hypothetical protein
VVVPSAAVELGAPVETVALEEGLMTVDPLPEGARVGTTTEGAPVGTTTVGTSGISLGISVGTTTLEAVIVAVGVGPSGYEVAGGAWI